MSSMQHTALRHVKGLEAEEQSVKLAERLGAPVCCNYQHNDAFPGRLNLSFGSRRAVRCLKNPSQKLVFNLQLDLQAFLRRHFDEISRVLCRWLPTACR